jgi:hypothetical protein
MDSIANPLPRQPRSLANTPPHGALSHEQRRCWLFWLVVGMVFCISAAYMTLQLRRGWVPHDDGAIGQMAERVLNGEIPHRDFDELYTGGLSFLNAIAFRLLGINLVSMRLVLYVFFLAWVPAIYYCASRLVSPMAAGAVTVLSVAWSVPNYASPVPSWYNLFFAVFGTAALLRFLDAGSRRWLFVAGLCGGLSFLAKLSGVYFIAATALFLVFHEQYSCDSNKAPGRSWPYTALVYALAGAVVATIFTICTAFRAEGLLLFALPGWTIAAALVWRETKVRPTASARRLSRLLHLLSPFVAGVCVPTTLFLLPYLLSGSLNDFIRGVFILPALRLQSASFPLISALAVLICAGQFLIFSTVLFLRWRGRNVLGSLFAVTLAILLWRTSSNIVAYRWCWISAYTLIPIVVVTGAITLMLRSSSSPGVDSKRQQQVLLVLAVIAYCGLVQLPFPAPIYFCYVTPLLALALCALVSLFDHPPRLALGAVLCFYVCFAVFRMTPSFIYHMNSQPIQDQQTAWLDLPRVGGLRVHGLYPPEYTRLVSLIREHAQGAYLYAGPDCPEVYFLTGLRNPTRTLFEFFDRTENRTERVLDALERHGVGVVALFSRPEFSGPIPADLAAELTRRYPNAARVGRFEVRWRP